MGLLALAIIESTEEKTMTIHAFLFLSLCIACSILGLTAEMSDSWATLAKVGAVVFGALFAGSLVIGKRIKFDPVLR
jgi:hypothetical protein